ncbi:hypothetical protein GCM10009016_27970 [Halomonas beimenensis]
MVSMRMSTFSNWASRLRPRLSAVMPVPSEMKKAVRVMAMARAGKNGGIVEPAGRRDKAPTTGIAPNGALL